MSMRWYHKGVILFWGALALACVGVGLYFAPGVVLSGMAMLVGVAIFAGLVILTFEAFDNWERGWFQNLLRKLFKRTKH